MGAIEGSSLGQAMRESLWLYPAIEIVHIVGIALLFGSIAVLDMRLLGVSPPPPAARAAAATSLLLWVSVIACGRLLAYF